MTIAHIKGGLRFKIQIKMSPVQFFNLQEAIVTTHVGKNQKGSEI
jgi:hypothetical protein